MSYHYNGEVYVDGVTVEVEAKAEGFYCSGDSFGCGCEPPDGDFEVTEVNIIKAYYDYPDDPNDRVEVTKELEDKVWKKLYKEEFKED